MNVKDIILLFSLVSSKAQESPFILLLSYLALKPLLACVVEMGLHNLN